MLSTRWKFGGLLRVVPKLDLLCRTFSLGKEIVRAENAREIRVPIPYGQIAGTLRFYHRRK